MALRLVSSVFSTRLFFALPALVASFGSINVPLALGQHNEHGIVTRLALQCPRGQRSDGICFEPHSLAQLAGTHLEIFEIPTPGGDSNGAVGSPDTFSPASEGQRRMAMRPISLARPALYR